MKKRLLKLFLAIPITLFGFLVLSASLPYWLATGKFLGDMYLSWASDYFENL
jgi:hypothetical protein